MSEDLSKLRARSTFRQLLVLLAGSMALVLLVASLVLREQALAGGVEHLRPLVELELRLVERLLQADGDVQAAQDLLTRLQLRVVKGPAPLSGQSSYPFARALGAAMAGQRPPGHVQLIASTPPQLWLRLQQADELWLVYPVHTQLQRVRNSALLILAGAAVVVFIGAAGLARRQTRPLRGLAKQASALISGQPVDQQQLHGASLELHALAQALASAGVQAREQARTREVMLAGISHDLRTPLARLRFAVELDTVGSVRSAMTADIEELDCLLGQFIAYARDGSTESVVEVALDTLLSGLVEHRSQPALWRLNAPAVRAGVRPLALRRALLNLMDNAEKYGQAPFGLELRVAITGARHILQICVSDHGDGIAAAEQARLLQPFERGAASRAGISGSGLGLAIVQRYVSESRGGLSFGHHAGQFQVRMDLPVVNSVTQQD